MRLWNSQYVEYGYVQEPGLLIYRIHFCIHLYTAISGKVVGKSASDNPERYCGWFWVHCSSKKFERMAREAIDVCLRMLKESNNKKFDSYSVRNNVLIISHVTFRDCRVHILSDNLSRNSCIWTGDPAKNNYFSTTWNLPCKALFFYHTACNFQPLRTQFNFFWVPTWWIRSKLPRDTNLDPVHKWTINGSVIPKVPSPRVLIRLWSVLPQNVQNTNAPWLA